MPVLFSRALRINYDNYKEWTSIYMKYDVDITLCTCMVLLRAKKDREMNVIRSKNDHGKSVLAIIAEKAG